MGLASPVRLAQYPGCALGFRKRTLDGLPVGYPVPCAERYGKQA